MLARRAIVIGPPPGIERQPVLLDIGPLPARGIGAGRRLDQRLQAFRLRRIVLHVEPVEIEGVADGLDLDAGGVDLGAAEIFEHLRRHQRHQHAENGEHHQQLDQGEAAVMPARATIDENSWRLPATRFSLLQTASS